MSIETEYECARCGSSIDFYECEWCPACGYYDEPDPFCPACHGLGRVAECMAGEQWCQTHPLPGCEGIERSTVGTFEYEDGL